MANRGTSQKHNRIGSKMGTTRYEDEDEIEAN